jgi:hypothetical protein
MQGQKRYTLINLANNSVIILYRTYCIEYESVTVYNGDGARGLGLPQGGHG